MTEDVTEDEVYLMALGLLVVRLRRHTDLAQGQLAQLVKTSQAMISRLERGQCDPGALQVRRLARAFGLTVPALYELLDGVLGEAARLYGGKGPWWEGGDPAWVRALVGLAVAGIQPP